jgi:hypothetical protein
MFLFLISEAQRILALPSHGQPDAGRGIRGRSPYKGSIAEKLGSC